MGQAYAGSTSADPEWPGRPLITCPSVFHRPGRTMKCHSRLQPSADRTTLSSKASSQRLPCSSRLHAGVPCRCDDQAYSQHRARQHRRCRSATRGNDFTATRPPPLLWPTWCQAMRSARMQREVVAQCGEINAHDHVPGHSQAPSMLLPTRVMLTTEWRSPRDRHSAGWIPDGNG